MTLTPRGLVPAQTRERRLPWLLCERVRRGNLKPRKHFRFLWRVLSNLEGKGDAYLLEAWGRGEAVQRCCPLGSALPLPLAGVQGVLRSCETVFLAASAKHGGMLAKHVKKQRSLGCRVSKWFLAEAGPQCLEALFLASSHRRNSGPRLLDLHPHPRRASCGKSSAVSTMRPRETSLPSLTLLYLASIVSEVASADTKAGRASCLLSPGRQPQTDHLFECQQQGGKKNFPFASRKGGP